MTSPNTIPGGQVPPTSTETQTPEVISKLSEQVSQTQAALAQLVELQKSQLESQIKPAEPIKPPEEFNAGDILNPKTPSGEYFAKVIQDREKRIVGTLEQEFNKKLDERLMQLETERAMNEKFQQLAQQRKVDETQIDEFKNWMSDPKNVDVNTLFEVFTKVHGASPQGGEPTTRMSSVGGAPGGGNADTGFLSDFK